MKQLLLIGFCLLLNLAHSQSPQLDTTFNTNDEALTEGFMIVGRSVIQPDGKILICNQNNWNSGSYRLLRLNSDGTLDSSFNVNSYSVYSPFSVGLQPDGKIIIYNNFDQNASIIRLNNDGSLDTGFLTASIVRANDFIVQPDGKLIVIGSFTSIGGVFANHIARLNTDGSLDTTFNVGGIGTGTALISRLLQQNDGKIVLIGNFTSYNNVSAKGIVRINSDGSRDTTFVSGTGFSFGDSYGEDALYTLVLQTDGKLLVGGNFSTYNGFSRNGLVRLNSDGSNDVSFSIGSGFKEPWVSGISGQTFYEVGNVNDVVVQADGKIIVAGRFERFNETTHINIVRLNSNGSLDITFKNDLGTFYPTTQEAAIDRTGFISYLNMLPNQKILIKGTFTRYNNTKRIYSAMIESDGKLDLSFNQGTSFDDSVVCSAIQNDGKILVGGSFTKYAGVDIKGIARLNDNGTLDTSFDIGSGIGSGSGIISSYVNTVAIQSDGKILIGGYFSKFNDVSKYGLVRVNSDGSFDPSFVDFPTNSGYVTKIMIQPDGKILLTTTTKILRLYQDGTVDLTFNQTLGSYIKIARRPDGKIFMYDNTSHYIRCLNNDGTEDLSFSRVLVEKVNAIEFQEDNKMVVIGKFSSISGGTIANIARLNVDGTFDVSFYPNQSLDFYEINAVQILSNGKILVGGAKTYLSIPNSLMKLYPNGSIDASYSSNNLIFETTPINAITGSYSIMFNYTSYPLNNPAVIYNVNVQSGKIYVGGNFSSYGGTARNFFLRLVDSTLNVNDFEASEELRIYPNPTADVLNISIKEGIEISEINIYNTLGQLVSYLPQAASMMKIDVGNLHQGTYFIKINSNKGAINKTFLKK